MKTILISIVAGSLLSALAAAQSSPAVDPASQTRGRWSGSTRLLSNAGVTTPNSMVYVVTNGVQFGAEDLRSGAFVPIGPGLAPQDAGVGLVPAPGGILLTLAFTGDLIAVNPKTGASSLFGKTGLADCSTPTSPCGPTSSGFLGNLGANLYATDISNNLYSLNPATGAATVIGPTGIPAIPQNLVNPDGSFNIYDANLFAYRGKLYTIFDGWILNPNTGAITAVVPGTIYEINTKTGQATWIANTALGLTSVATVGDSVYGFDAITGLILSIDMTNGQTNTVSQIDPTIIIAVCGSTPSPASLGN